jgi:hypothetical protein
MGQSSRRLLQSKIGHIFLRAGAKRTRKLSAREKVEAVGKSN